MTLVLALPGVSGSVTACRVSGNRYVVCFDTGARRPRVATVSRQILAASIARGVRIVGRI
ncbi:hypothetical protein [Gemmatimonas sp.]